MKTPRQMKKENLVFFAEQLQHLLYLEQDDTWNPAKKWDAETLSDIGDIMHRFGLVPEKKFSPFAPEALPPAGRKAPRRR